MGVGADGDVDDDASARRLHLEHAIAALGRHQVAAAGRVEVQVARRAGQRHAALDRPAGGVHQRELVGVAQRDGELAGAGVGGDALGCVADLDDAARRRLGQRRRALGLGRRRQLVHGGRPAAGADRRERGEGEGDGGETAHRGRVA